MKMTEHIVKSMFNKDKAFLKKDEGFVKALALDFYQARDVKFKYKFLSGPGMFVYELFVYKVGEDSYIEEKYAKAAADLFNENSYPMLTNPTTKPKQVKCITEEFHIMQVINLLLKLDSAFENSIAYLQSIRGAMLGTNLGIV